jgi:exportin-T
MEDELVRAILIASDPSQGSLHHQALEYLANIQQNATETWPLALALFMDVAPNGVRKHPPQARFFGLRVLDEFFDNRYVHLIACSWRLTQLELVQFRAT